MTSPYLEPKTAEKERLEERYKIREWICGGLDKWTLALEQKTAGFEIISNLVRYCHIYQGRCTDLPETTHFMPLVEGFVEKMEKKVSAWNSWTSQTGSANDVCDILSARPRDTQDYRGWKECQVQILNSTPFFI